MHISDMVMHVDEELGENTRRNVERTITAHKGVIHAHFNERRPHLMLVSINGADSGDTKKMGFDRLIRPLGEGTFDNSKVMKILDEIGYAGPVGLQCYNVRGDNRANLKKSIVAWRELNK